jgi:hypothetical protein
MNDQTELLTIKADVPTTLALEAEAARTCLLKLYNRLKSVSDLRTSQGKSPVAATNRAVIAACSDSLAGLQKVGLDLEALLTVTTPAEKADVAEARKAYTEYLQTVSVTYRRQQQ